MTIWLVGRPRGHRAGGSRRKAARRRARAVHPALQRGPAESAVPPHLLHVRLERGRAPTPCSTPPGSSTRSFTAPGACGTIYDAWYLPIAGDVLGAGRAGSVAARPAIDARRRHRAPVLLRIGLGRLPRAAGAVAAVEGASADAYVRPRSSSRSSGASSPTSATSPAVACFRGRGRYCRERVRSRTREPVVRGFDRFGGFRGFTWRSRCDPRSLSEPAEPAEPAEPV